MAGGNAAAQLGASLTSKIDEAISYLRKVEEGTDAAQNFAIIHYSSTDTENFDFDKLAGVFQ